MAVLVNGILCGSVNLDRKDVPRDPNWTLDIWIEIPHHRKASNFKFSIARDGRLAWNVVRKYW